MSGIDATMQAAHANAIALVGVPCTFQRVSGQAPNASTFSVTVTALVRSYTPDMTAQARQGEPATRIGSISQGQRQVIVMAEDLAAKRFPLPLRKNDKIIVVDTGQELTIDQVDSFHRAIAGAIELRASGVQ